MNLIFILDNSKILGGGEYSIFKFAEHLGKIGHKIVIFATTKNQIFKIENSKSFTVYYRGMIPRLIKGMGLIDRLWDKLYTKLKIEPFLRKESRIDYVIGYHTTSTIKANKLAKKFGIKSATFVFETPSWMHSQLKDRWLEEYHGRFRKLWNATKEELKIVQIIFSNSDLTKKENEKWLGRKIDATIYPGLDATLADKTVNILKENQIIYLGRLNKYKNVDVLIKALSQINPPQLVVCGDGEEKNKLIKLSTGLNVKCDFKGSVSEEDKWKEIKRSLFMVFPSSFEGFGMPPMEALYCGIPCICADIPILREVYKDKVEYFKQDNIKDLMEKIESLLEDPDYRRKRGLEGRKFIKSRYSWEKSAKKIIKILQDGAKA